MRAAPMVLAPMRRPRFAARRVARPKVRWQRALRAANWRDLVGLVELGAYKGLLAYAGWTLYNHGYQLIAMDQVTGVVMAGHPLVLDGFAAYTLGMLGVAAGLVRDWGPLWRLWNTSTLRPWRKQCPSTH